jgi:rare lipoprotein A
MKKILMASAAVLLLSGCSEIEFGSFLFKSATNETYNAPRGTVQQAQKQQGTFKVGNPYTVNGTVYRPVETYSYVETGISSWYGPGFHGRKTASGEVYDKHELTAAHRTLQMPSLVRVTHLDNGRSVIVRINDRGPFAKGRIIDVSQRAAELLGMIGTGTAKVKVELLAEESKAIAQAARRGENVRGVELAMNTEGRLPPTMTDAGDALRVSPQEAHLAQVAQLDNIQGHYKSGRFYPDAVATQVPVNPTGIYVQAGAFGVEDNATRLSRKLASIAPATVEPLSYGGKTIYKVKLGPLQTVREADSVLSRVLASGHSDAIITVR